MASRLCGYKGDRPSSTRRWSSSSTRRRSSTTTSSTAPICAGAGWRCIRGGATTSLCCWATTCTSSRMAMALTQDSLEIIRLLCDVTLRMIEGELFQLTKTGDVDISEEEHFEIIRRKTAFLFGGCAQIGGMLGEVTPERATALREYGFNLGVAFQLVDDLLDYAAEPRRSANPSAATCARGRSRCPSSSCFGAAATRPTPDPCGRQRSRGLAGSVAGNPAAARASIARWISHTSGRSSTPNAPRLPRRVPAEPRARRPAGAPRLRARTRPVALSHGHSARQRILEFETHPDPSIATLPFMDPLTASTNCATNPSPRRAVLRPQQPGDFRRGVRSPAPRARALEAENPDLVTPDSPTQRVAGRPTDGFPTVEHVAPMLSLDNAYDENELRAFDERLRCGSAYIKRQFIEQNGVIDPHVVFRNSK